MKTAKIFPAGVALAAILVTGAGVAFAQGAGDNSQAHAPQAEKVNFPGHGGGRGHGMRMFGAILNDIDANGDAAVSQEEIDSYRAGLVTSADTSGDGNITLDEFETIFLTMLRSRMVDAFQDLDDDGNGMVTQAEMDKRFGNIVTLMDRNDDGVLSRDDRPSGAKGKWRKGHDRDRG